MNVAQHPQTEGHGKALSHVMVASQSAVQQARLRRLLDSVAPDARLTIARSLTETYDRAEHDRPDCVLMCARLADDPGFAVLSSLFRMMQIGCVMLGGAAPIAGQFARITEDPDAEALRSALKQAHRPAGRTAAVAPPVAMDQREDLRFEPARLILIGSSTGGIDALLRIVGQFPANCPPTLIVQHTGEGFACSLIRLLNNGSPAKVEAARDGVSPQAGHIYLAPESTCHLQLAGRDVPRLHLSESAPVSGHRPSVDALFQSATPFARQVTAAILTGMGRDGAAGLLALRQAGAHTIGQDRATSTVYGMPRAAKEIGAVIEELPLERIAGALLRASTKRPQIQ